MNRNYWSCRFRKKLLKFLQGAKNAFSLKNIYFPGFQTSFFKKLSPPYSSTIFFSTFKWRNIIQNLFQLNIKVNVLILKYIEKQNWKTWKAWNSIVLETKDFCWGGGDLCAFETKDNWFNFHSPLWRSFSRKCIQIISITNEIYIIFLPSKVSCSISLFCNVYIKLVMECSYNFAAV